MPRDSANVSRNNIKISHVYKSPSLRRADSIGRARETTAYFGLTLSRFIDRSDSLRGEFSPFARGNVQRATARAFHAETRRFAQQLAESRAICARARRVVLHRGFFCVDPRPKFARLTDAKSPTSVGAPVCIASMAPLNQLTRYYGEIVNALGAPAESGAHFAARSPPFAR